MRLLFSIIVFQLTSVLHSQQLTIEETTEYINNTLNQRISLDVNNDGSFELKQINLDWLLEENGQKEIKKVLVNGRYVKARHRKYEYNYRANVMDIEITKSINTFKEFSLIFKCNNKIPCINDSSKRRNHEDFQIDFIDLSKRDKLFNAFSYLFRLIKDNPDYIDYDDDPFSNQNFKKTFSYITGDISSDRISLMDESGIFYVDIHIFDLKKSFVIDSGASDVLISAEVERELIARDLLKEEDYLDPALYRIADGSVISQRRVVLKEIKIGDFTVNNITASIGASGTPLLLGKSFLDKFSTWSIDNKNKTLLLEK